MNIINLHIPAELQAHRGYSLPKQEVIDWLQELSPNNYNLCPYSSGCDVQFFNENDAAIFKLRWMDNQSKEHSV